MLAYLKPYKRKLLLSRWAPINHIGISAKPKRHTRLTYPHQAEQEKFLWAYLCLPDSCWPLLRDTVKAVAQSHFRKGCRRQQLRPPDTQVELQEQHRCKLAIQHSPKVQVPEGAGQLHTLAACLQQWHLSAQYTNARDFRQVWQAAGTLSGRQIGPNRRKYDSPPTCRPSAGLWTKYMRGPGCEGGCLATSTSWDQHVLVHSSKDSAWQAKLLQDACYSREIQQLVEAAMLGR